MHVVGTAGHVDHGKSSLVERLTGIDPDRFAEEKARGLTIDLGFAWLRLPSGAEVGIVDVPGHERFIKNMLAGAGSITMCLFVVAANEGWMPQSAEHLAIINLLGVPATVIAITKSDTVDAEGIARVVGEVTTKVDGTILENARIIPCSTHTGDGIDQLVAELDRLVTDTPRPRDDGRTRLWVDRVFTIAGAGTVVTGTLAGGSLAVGDTVEIAPEGRRARIRAIQSHERELATVAPGNRSALNLAGIPRDGARRGDAVVTPGAFPTTHVVDVALVALDTTESEGITAKGAHLLYAGSAETDMRIKLIDADRIPPGASGYAQLRLHDPLPLQRGDRFVVRDVGRGVTVGGGRVLDPMPAPYRRKDTGRGRLLEVLDRSDATGALEALIAATGRIDRGEALLRAGTPEPGPRTITLGDVFVSDDELARMSGAVEETLRAHHRDHPLEPGIAREALRASVALETEAFTALLERLGEIIEGGSVVRLAKHRVELDPHQDQARSRLLSELDSAAFAPPPAHDLGVDDALLRALTDAGDLVRIGDFYLTGGRAAEARTRVRDRITSGGPVTVAEIRDLLGTTRKYAVPLCEWLDATGATRRQGDLRTLGPTP